MKITNSIISTPSESRNISGNRINRIDTPGVNKYVWGVFDTTSNMMSDANNVKKFDTSVQGSTTQERNMELSRIEEESLKSIFPELGTKLESSLRVNLTNSVVCESPKFKRLGHPPTEIADIRNLNYISATRPKNCNGLQRNMERDDKLGYMHDFETTSETTAYRNHIKNSEIETREVFEQETSSPENIQRTLPMNIETRLDNNQLTRSTDISKHEETHNPEPSSSDTSETLSSD